MSKRRDKKSPMFVSNLNADYEFVDYTDPNVSPAGPSSFGNPNVPPPSSSPSTFKKV